MAFIELQGVHGSFEYPIPELVLTNKHFPSYNRLTSKGLLIKSGYQLKFLTILGQLNIIITTLSLGHGRLRANDGVLERGTLFIGRLFGNEVCKKTPRTEIFP